MNSFEKALAAYIGEKRLRKIQSVTVGIGGAGGLGSNCAFNLVRSGFKSFVIADFDVIDYSNLNRQFYFYRQVGRKKVEVLRENLLNINPDLNIKAIGKKVTEENVEDIFRDCDIVVEAFDQVCYKRLMVESFMNSSKFLVAASGLAGWGNSDEIKIRKIKDNFYVVGDFATEVGPGKPPLSPRVNIAAAKQADIILEYVLNRMEE